VREQRELKALIRRSRVLDPALKRAWLGVLPLMAERHRAELRQILLLEGTDGVGPEQGRPVTS
jgi:hypothetical protein